MADGKGGSDGSDVATDKPARLDKEDVKAIALEVFSMMKAVAKDNPAKTGKDGDDPPASLPEDIGRFPSGTQELLAPHPLGHSFPLFICFAGEFFSPVGGVPKKNIFTGEVLIMVSHDAETWCLKYCDLP